MEHLSSILYLNFVTGTKKNKYEFVPLEAVESPTPGLVILPDRIANILPSLVLM